MKKSRSRKEKEGDAEEDEEGKAGKGTRWEKKKLRFLRYKVNARRTDGRTVWWTNTTRTVKKWKGEEGEWWKKNLKKQQEKIFITVWIGEPKFHEVLKKNGWVRTEGGLPKLVDGLKKKGWGKKRRQLWLSRAIGIIWNCWQVICDVTNRKKSWIKRKRGNWKVNEKLEFSGSRYFSRCLPEIRSFQPCDNQTIVEFLKR